MKTTVRIALVGDHNPEITAHRAIPKALELAAGTTGWPVEPVWIATQALERDAEEQLSAYDGVWCVPGSPYASMDGALLASRFARERGRPFLGTCGGFQHALIEYARNVLGLLEADHAESNPAASMPLISPLACSLVEGKGTITLKEGSRISAIYGTTEIVEQYNCSFGFNPRYQARLEGRGMRLTGTDAAGEIRVVELAGHPFFIATLFQPERSALRGIAHPLVTAYVQAAADHGRCRVSESIDAPHR